MQYLVGYLLGPASQLISNVTTRESGFLHKDERFNIPTFAGGVAPLSQIWKWCGFLHAEILAGKV